MSVVSKMSRPVADTVRVYVELAARGWSLAEIAARLQMWPRSLRAAIARREDVTNQDILVLPLRPEHDRLRTELRAWYRAGCPL